MKIVIAALCLSISIGAIIFVLLEIYNLRERRRELAKFVGLDIALDVDKLNDMPAILRGYMVKKRQRHFEHLASAQAPHMLHAVALGIKAGLSFENAFSLYHSHFSDELAFACKEAHQAYRSGLTTRKEALSNLGERTNNDTIRRFASTIDRSLRYGDGAYATLRALSKEAEDIHFSEIQEKVTKAPVQMLFPTAGLILPAMLLLIMGPVVLEIL